MNLFAVEKCLVGSNKNPLKVPSKMATNYSKQLPNDFKTSTNLMLLVLVPIFLELVFSKIDGPFFLRCLPFSMHFLQVL